MVVVDPVPETEEDHLADNRVIAVDGVAASGEVAVMASAIFQHVIDLVLQTFETQGGPEFVSFAGMVEDHIQDDFDACLMQGSDHLLELIDLGTRFFAGSIPSMGRKEREWVVAPVVVDLFLLAAPIQDGVLVDRHEFDCGDSQRLEIGDLFDHAQVGARVLNFGGARLREPAHVHLVDDGLRELAAQMPISLPIEVVIDHDALRGAKDSVFARQKISGQGFCVRVDEPSAAVEPISPFGRKGAICLEVVELPSPDSGDKDTPDISPAVGIAIQFDNLGRFEITDPIVEQDAQPNGSTAEDDKLHAVFAEHGPIGKDMGKIENGVGQDHAAHFQWTV